MRELLIALGAAGAVHGLIGAALISIREKEDMLTRAVAGCTAGLSLGIAGMVGSLVRN